MSKNGRLAHSTLTRAVGVAVAGTATASLPSLGLPAASTAGKVKPPSTDSSTLTAAQLTGDAVVFATSQVTVSWVPSVQVTAVSGEVTRNGPAAEMTFTSIASEATPPPPEWLSRMVARNCIVLVKTGSDSLTGIDGGTLPSSRMAPS